MPKPAPAPALSRRTRALFWALTLALPLLFFLALEGGLRLAGYGHSYPLFEPVEGYEAYRMQSRQVARRYFHHTAEAPTGLHDLFLAEKPPDEVRLFVQGGSTAAGFPFYHGAAFSRMLEARLAETFPGRPVEVVNTAMAAVNSYTLLDLSAEILRERPDAVLIYAGHNEYYGALGVGSTESIGQSRALVNLYLRLRPLRTVQLLRDGLGGLARIGAPAAGERPGGSLMARMVGRQAIPYGSDDYWRGLRQFEGNLSDLLARYRRAGVPVYVATLVANERDHAPFGSAFLPETDEADYRQRLAAARARLDAGDAAGAAAALEALTRADTLAAEGFFALGRAYEAAGDTAAALRAYRAASDRDALRFRAPTAFNDVIRRVATAHGATVVDVDARFRREAPGGVIGEAHMLEHLHPTVDGYFLIADAFYEALLEAGTAGRAPFAGLDARPIRGGQARGAVRLSPADSLVGVLRLRQLLAGWPFAPPDAPRPRPEDLLPADSPEARIALDLIRQRKEWLQGNEELAALLEEDGRIEEARRTREAMLLAYPMLPEAHLSLAGFHTRFGDLDRAVHYYEGAIARGDRSGNALGLLGAIVLQRGMTARAAGDAAAADHLERARDLLDRARRQNPRNPQTLYNLSGAYAQLGRYDESRRTAEALLQLQPNHPGGRQLLASLPRTGATPR